MTTRKRAVIALTVIFAAICVAADATPVFWATMLLIGLLLLAVYPARVLWRKARPVLATLALFTAWLGPIWLVWALIAHTARDLHYERAFREIVLGEQREFQRRMLEQMEQEDG